MYNPDEMSYVGTISLKLAKCHVVFGSCSFETTKTNMIFMIHSQGKKCHCQCAIYIQGVQDPELRLLFSGMILYKISCGIVEHLTRMPEYVASINRLTNSQKNRKSLGFHVFSMINNRTKGSIVKL